MEEKKLISKECTWCGENKPLSEFYSQTKESKTKGKYIYYNPECKECTKNNAYKWKENNPEYMSNYLIEYHQIPDVKIKQNESKRKYQISGKQKEWQRNNKDKVKEYNEYRRHRTHNITKQEWEECKGFFDYSCAYCGIEEQEAKKTQGNYLHKEHVDHNGANDITNCIPSCKSCNSSKGDKDLDLWYSESNLHFNKNRYEQIIKWLSKFREQIEE